MNHLVECVIKKKNPEGKKCVSEKVCPKLAVIFLLRWKGWKDVKKRCRKVVSEGGTGRMLSLEQKGAPVISHFLLLLKDIRPSPRRIPCCVSVACKRCSRQFLIYPGYR